METLTINDCGTAHEDKLLEIYNDVVSIEKIRKGKEPTSLEKSKIEMQVAEAYQTILNNCKDGGSIGQALNLLGKRITTSQVSINEISKIAVDVSAEVYNTNSQTVENNGASEMIGAVGAAQIASDMYGKSNESTTIELPKLWGDITTPEIERDFEQTNQRAEAGDEKALAVKGLINYSLDYLRITDDDKPKGKEAMVLTLINNLSNTGDKAAIGIARQLSEKYGFDVFSANENGNQILDQEKLYDMYRERMLGINPKAADSMVDLFKTRKDYLIERGKETPRTVEEITGELDEKKKQNMFIRQYNKCIKEGRHKDADELVRNNSNIAKMILIENVRGYGMAQISGNKKYMMHLQDINSNLASSVARASQKGKALDADRVDIADVVASVNTNPKRLVSDEREI